MTSIKEHCCGANVFFDRKMADKQYRQYLKKGPSRITARMIRQLESQSLEGKSMLDIGGGIGALQWWFLQNSGDRTISIDASKGYLELAERHAIEHGWQTKSSFIFGDFADMHTTVGQADYITLDKMVCCYPNYEDIIQISCKKAASHVSLSYPMDGFLSRIVAFFGIAIAKFKSKTFRPYIHPVEKIRKAFDLEGYERISYSLAFPWHVETYRRIKK